MMIKNKLTGLSVPAQQPLPMNLLIAIVSSVLPGIVVLGYAVFYFAYLTKPITLYCERVKDMAILRTIFINTINSGWFAMKVKKFFRLVLDVEAVIDVEELNETDYGIDKYFKQFLNQLVNDREAVENYLLYNLIERFLEHSDDDLRNFLNNSGKYENDATYILRAASKCEHEVSNYFKNAFKSCLNQVDSAGITNGKNTIELDTARALILNKLIDHLTKLEPINIDCYELPVESVQREKPNKAGIKR